MEDHKRIYEELGLNYIWTKNYQEDYVNICPTKIEEVKEGGIMRIMTWGNLGTS